MAYTLEEILRPQDLEDAEEAWKLYKHTMRNHPRRQLRKRELIAGFLGGVCRERSRQMAHVHPNIVRAQYIVDFAEMEPELFAVLKAENPDLVRRLREALQGE